MVITRKEKRTKTGRTTKKKRKDNKKKNRKGKE